MKLTKSKTEYNMKYNNTKVPLFYETVIYVLGYAINCLYQTQFP